MNRIFIFIRKHLPGFWNFLVFGKYIVSQLFYRQKKVNTSRLVIESHIQSGVFDVYLFQANYLTLQVPNYIIINQVNSIDNIDEMLELLSRYSIKNLNIYGLPPQIEVLITYLKTILAELNITVIVDNVIERKVDQDIIRHLLALNYVKIENKK